MADLIGHARKWLPRELSDIEERVANSFRVAGDTLAPRLTGARVPGGSVTQVRPYELALVEGAATVVLPAPSDALQGATVVVARTAASGTVVVRCSSGLVSGAPFVNLATSTARPFWCSGSDWY